MIWNDVITIIFLICNSGPDYGPSYNPINLYKVSLQFNTVKFDHIYENHLLGEIEHDLSFCSVQFRFEQTPVQ